MKKRIVAVILAMAMVFGVSACGSDDSSKKEETTQEASAAKEDTAEDEEEPEEAEEEKPEKTGAPLTGSTEITDEMLQEIYVSIKESVTKDYLEPNNIEPASFSWPEQSTFWSGFESYLDFYQLEFETFQEEPFFFTELSNLTEKENELVKWCATRQVDKLNNKNFFFPGTVYVPGCLCNVF